MPTSGVTPMQNSQEDSVSARSIEGTIPAIPRMRAIHQWFESQVIRTPDAVAVTFELVDMTYRDLNEKANRLAHRLRELGVGRNSIVGLCAERSHEMVIGILSILKAGGAYLPIDPKYPQERQSFLLADAKAIVLLTQRHLSGRFPRDGVSVVFFDDANTLALRRENLECESGSDDLAYVIYTSGSTGQPKGVLVTQANLTRLFEATDPWFRFDHRDTWTLFHSISFDFSVWELWGALAHGGRLVIVTHAISRSPEDFYRLLREERVTVLNQTPSSFRQLVRAEEGLGGRAEDLALRLVIFGGEALQPKGLRSWFERHGDRVPLLINMYGITETTVHVTYRPLSLANLGDEAPASPIGRPIPDLQVHLLDENLRPVPEGQPGEMFVGGAGVARGYLNRSELTASRFIDDPFSDKPGARLYRSGDLARRLPSGELDYLGRADDQVKIRGFRIELGEIEAALARYPEVQESIVIAREYGSGYHRLIAYVASRAGAIDTPTLRKKLGEALPDYMIPSAIILLDALPLNANGKVDRAALPAPPDMQQVESTSSISENTEAEVAAIWSDVLGRTVETDDNFFDLGGCSVDVVEVHARLRERFGQDLPLIDMFEYPTVKALARKLDGRIVVGSGFNRDVDRARSQREALARQRRAREARS